MAIGVILLAIVFYLVMLAMYSAYESWAVDKQEDWGDQKTLDFLE